LAASVLSEHQDVIDQLCRLAGRTAQTASDRNAFVHAKYAGSSGSAPSVLSIGANKLVNTNLEAELVRMIEGFGALYKESWQQLARVCHALGRDMPDLETPPPKTVKAIRQEWRQANGGKQRR
jgi:hypothetical protein